MNSLRFEWEPDVHRVVGGVIAGVIGVAAELVCAIAVPEVEQSGRGHVTHTDRACKVGVSVVWIKAKIAHQRIEDRCCTSGEEVNRRSIGGVAYGDLLVRQGPLPGRAPECWAKTSPDGTMVISRPGIKCGSVHDGKCARNHRWTELRLAHPLQRGFIPSHNNAVICMRTRTDDLAE